MDLLQPFIVTSWYGHRDEPEIPDVVRQVWEKKFKPVRGGPGQARPRPNGPRPNGPGQGGPGQGGSRGNQRHQHSNVDLAVLDSGGELIRSFDGFRRAQQPGRPPRQQPGQQPRPRPGQEPGQQAGRRGPETLSEYTARELKLAMADMDLSGQPTAKHPLTLPDLDGSRGMRVFVRLMDDRMRAYRAPVVEVVPLKEDDWQGLAYPETERSVDAAILEKWLCQVYPPGVMERTDPRTKLVYQIETVEGSLSLSPAGSDGKLRHAVLRGQVRLTDEGPGDFSFEGTLQAVLTYGPSESRVRSLRGVFEGVYPRSDRIRNRTREIPLLAAFESLPD